MNTALTLLSLLVSNVCVITYAHLSSKSHYSALLLPIIFFPLLYVLNATYSGGFQFGAKAGIGVATIALISLGLNYLVLFLANTFIWKEPFGYLHLLGAALILSGGILLVVTKSQQ